jgi:hypothetical protein
MKNKRNYFIWEKLGDEGIEKFIQKLEIYQNKNR